VCGVRVCGVCVCVCACVCVVCVWCSCVCGVWCACVCVCVWCVVCVSVCTYLVETMLCFFTTHCSLRLIVRSDIDVPTFATRRLHACHHARAPSGGRWNCVREMSGKFCLNIDLHVTFKYLLQSVKLRHGADGFTSSPKEGVLRNFSP
jgi:hypothetical protein